MSNFYVDKLGVWHVPPLNEKGEQPDAIRICSPLEVVAITRDHNNENFGKLLQFSDPDNVKHLWAMPLEFLAADGLEYRKILMSMGLQIEEGKNMRSLLSKYIQSMNPSKRMRCVTKLGWYEGIYVMPNEVIGQTDSNEEIVFQSPNPTGIFYGTKGDLQDWQKNICHFCADNSRLCFALCAAFAAPVLNLLDEESGGFHFRGPSSIGKTTLLKIATSVYGPKRMMQTWRATTNGLESVAAHHNDGLLSLDELAQLDPREAGNTAYLLCNGAGKMRARKNGGAKEKYSWRLIFLSSGEISFPDHIKQSGQKVRGGQEVRVIDIPADTGEHGIFEYLHGCPDGSSFSRVLATNAELYHGVAGRAFIKYLAENREAVILRIKLLCHEFTEQNAPPNATGQVLRVLNKFAIIAASGSLAIEAGISDLPENEAFWAASQCFTAWLKNRGGVSAQEGKEALLQVRHFFELHGDSRFSPWDQKDEDYPTKTINRSGYKRNLEGEWHYYVFPEAFKQDVCQGLDSEVVAKILIEKGWLLPDSEGKSSRPERLPCSETSIRCYHFNGQKVFSDES